MQKTNFENINKKEFEKIFLSYRNQMILLALSVLHDEHDAEDTVSEVFLKLAEKHLQKVMAIEKETDIRNYLLKATKNTALNTLKTKFKNKVSIDDLIENNSRYAKENHSICFVEKIHNKFEAERILEAISLMKEKYRNVLYLRFVLGMTVPEISEKLNQTIDATKKQLERGKKTLIEKINKY